MTRTGSIHRNVMPLFSFKRFIDACSGAGDDARSDILIKSALILHDRITTFGPAEWNEQVIDRISSRSSVKRTLVEKSILDLEDHDIHVIEDVAPDWIVACLESWAARGDLGFRQDSLLEKIAELRAGQPMEIYNTPLLGLFMSTKFGFSYHTDRDELEQLCNYWGEVNATPLTATREMEISLPLIDDLDYDAIFELRRSSYIGSFREFVYQARTSGTAGAQLRDEIEDGIWNVVGSRKPRANGSVWSRTLAAAPVPLPIPLPNPYGVFKEVKEGREERKLFNDLGWVWFIHEVREQGGKS
jgi:hypothetical protein